MISDFRGSQLRLGLPVRRTRRGREASSSLGGGGRAEQTRENTQLGATGRTAGASWGLERAVVRSHCRPGDEGAGAALLVE